MWNTNYACVYSFVASNSPPALSSYSLSPSLYYVCFIYMYVSYILLMNEHTWVGLKLRALYENFYDYLHMYD